MQAGLSGQVLSAGPQQDPGPSASPFLCEDLFFFWIIFSASGRSFKPIISTYGQRETPLGWGTIVTIVSGPLKNRDVLDSGDKYYL